MNMVTVNGKILLRLSTVLDSNLNIGFDIYNLYRFEYFFADSMSHNCRTFRRVVHPWNQHIFPGSNFDCRKMVTWEIVMIRTLRLLNTCSFGPNRHSFFESIFHKQMVSSTSWTHWKWWLLAGHGVPLWDCLSSTNVDNRSENKSNKNECCDGRYNI